MSGSAGPAPAIARVAVIGAECTGKSTLCEALGARLPAGVVNEALREFCERHRRTPRADEQAALLSEQRHREHAALARARERGLSWVVVDSTPLATALYSAQLFDDESLLPEAIAHQRGYQVTLLTDIDGPWVPDGIQRDGPAARADFHQRLTRLLARERLPHLRLTGTPAHRLEHALAAIRSATPLPPG